MASSQPLMTLPTVLILTAIVGMLIVTTPPASAQTADSNGDIPGAELISITTGTIPSGPGATTMNITASGSPASKLAASTGSVSRKEEKERQRQRAIAGDFTNNEGSFFYYPPKGAFIRSVEFKGWNKKLTRAYFKVGLGGKPTKTKTVYVRVPKGTFIGLIPTWSKSVLNVFTMYVTFD